MEIYRCINYKCVIVTMQEKERKRQMKNYLCIGIYKEISCKEVALSKGKAYEGFWNIFGAEIEAEWKAKEVSFERKTTDCK